MIGDFRCPLRDSSQPLNSVHGERADHIGLREDEDGHMSDLDRYIPEKLKRDMKWDSLAGEQRQAIVEYGSWMFDIAHPTVADIDDIKYDGRLVILDDGSRWEVDSLDVYDVEFWSRYSKVAVIDGVMYCLDDADHATVTEEV